MENVSTEKTTCFIGFKQSVDGFSLPENFTFPFYYEPHPLSVLAAKELQQHLQTQTDWVHNFGLIEGQEGLVIGKMFGVLVVQNSEGKLGYLAAYSGKLADSNHHAHFVPPVFDMLTDGSFFRVGEIEINQVTIDLQRLEINGDYLNNKHLLNAEIAKQNAELELHKKAIKEGKRERKIRREKAQQELDPIALETLLEELRKESLKEQYFFKDFTRNMKENFSHLQEKVDVFESEISRLKVLRKSMSNALQKRLFDEYHFLNQHGEIKSLHEIFKNYADKIEGADGPPAGAGECAAPKLLQYAFKHQLKPICMAEFWWGASPKSEIRNHGQFYGACKGKCEPILAHMLHGIKMDDNPMMASPDLNITIDTVYEDEYVAVINKPAEFLSVPGINVYDSVFARMKQKYPNATGPLIVHRLDMATSGLMLIAKTKDVHQHLQDQFIKRTIKKRYVALLDGILEKDEGFVNLPLRVDLDDRPRQLVCYEYGKPAQTKWEVIERKNNRTKVYFYPLTGRTHQLRVHSAHFLGLNTPIVGDDLYGNKANRLHLHAEMLEFVHPQSGERMVIQTPAEF